MAHGLDDEIGQVVDLAGESPRHESRAHGYGHSQTSNIHAVGLGLGSRPVMVGLASPLGQAVDLAGRGRGIMSTLAAAPPGSGCRPRRRNSRRRIRQTRQARGWQA